MGRRDGRCKAEADAQQQGDLQRWGLPDSPGHYSLWVPFGHRRRHSVPGHIRSPMSLTQMMLEVLGGSPLSCLREAWASLLVFACQRVFRGFLQVM